MIRFHTETIKISYIIHIATDGSKDSNRHMQSKSDIDIMNIHNGINIICSVKTYSVQCTMSISIM